MNIKQFIMGTMVAASLMGSALPVLAAILCCPLFNYSFNYILYLILLLAQGLKKALTANIVQEKSASLLLVIFLMTYVRHSQSYLAMYLNIIDKKTEQMRKHIDDLLSLFLLGHKLLIL